MVYVASNFHDYVSRKGDILNILTNLIVQRGKIVKEVVESIAKTGKCKPFDLQAGKDLGEGLVAFSEMTCAQSIQAAVEIDGIRNKVRLLLAG